MHKGKISMKLNYLLLLIFLCTTSLFSYDNSFERYEVSVVPSNMTVATKKERFYHLLTPAVEKVHKELILDFLRVESNIKNNRRQTEVKNLKIKYKVKTDLELLQAMKPHPQSIVIAQAAMESAWATSRFFREANNVFGMWSKNPKEPRIPAGIKRNDGRTIYLRKFNSIEEAVRAYYRLMARGKHFKEFRKVRYETDDVHIIVKKLDKYSEIGDLYGQELSAMIRFNKLTSYDK